MAIRMDASLITIVLVGLLLTAAVYDSYKHKIPNYISLAGWILAPSLYAIFYGTDGFLGSIYGLALTLVLTFPLYALRWMGAGDVKLMTSVGAFVGVKSALMALLFIVLSGAVFSVLFYIYQRSLSVTLNRLLAMASMSSTFRKPVYIPPTDSTSRLLIPYAIPIAIGTVLYLFYANWEIHSL